MLTWNQIPCNLMIANVICYFLPPYLLPKTRLEKAALLGVASRPVWNSIHSLSTCVTLERR